MEVYFVIIREIGQLDSLLMKGRGALFVEPFGVYHGLMLVITNQQLYSTSYSRNRFFRSPPSSSRSRSLSYACIRFFVGEDF